MPSLPSARLDVQAAHSFFRRTSSACSRSKKNASRPTHRGSGRRGRRRVGKIRAPMTEKNIWRLCERIGYPELKPHDLHHGVAMEVYEAQPEKQGVSFTSRLAAAATRGRSASGDHNDPASTAAADDGGQGRGLVRRRHVSRFPVR
jgi:hypothetical protein